MPLLHLIQLEGVPVLEQLKIEEALLRADERNWCLLNKRASPSIVMGISAKAERVIDLSYLRQRPIPTIRRFSGGGTVVVDENTFFATFICNSDPLQVPCFPEKIHSWAESLYQNVFKEASFKLRENDYVFGERKFGGNAQYLRKERWLHHTSFLWDYDPERMKYLLLPEKRPKYRFDRTHEDFLCSLKGKNFSDIESFEAGLLDAIGGIFTLRQVSMRDLQEVLLRPHRKATELIPLETEDKF